MAKFEDKSGRKYTVEITRGHLKALRTDCGVDLRDALKPGHDSLAEAVGDPDKFGQMLWILCGPQAEKYGFTPDTFADDFDGSVCRAAAAAIFEAVVDFSQGPEAAEKAGRAMRTGLTKADATFAGAWEATEASLTSNNGATSLPASADAATPTA